MEVPSRHPALPGVGRLQEDKPTPWLHSISQGENQTPGNILATKRFKQFSVPQAAPDESPALTSFIVSSAT
jgi:hypothetical protein